MKNVWVGCLTLRKKGKWEKEGEHPIHANMIKLCVCVCYIY